MLFSFGVETGVTMRRVSYAFDERVHPTSECAFASVGMRAIASRNFCSVSCDEYLTPFGPSPRNWPSYS